MTVPRDQEWLTVAQVAEAYGKKPDWVYDQIRTGNSNRAGTNGIPKRMVKTVGGTKFIHRSFVFTDELQPVPNNVVALPQPAPVVDEAALARAFVDELIARLLSGEVARRSA